MGDALSKITNNILNLVASVSLLLLVYSLFIIRGIQPQGYTINIYEQLPFNFYLTLLFCYLSACVLLLAYRKMSAVLILILVHITILITPYMLGYVAVGRGNEFLFMGLTGESVLSGPSSLSPTGPLFFSALSLISGMGTSALSYFLPVFFSIMFIIGMFLFYRVFMSREKLVSVGFLSSLIPYFGHFQISTSPYYLCFCLVPLYLFVMRNALSGKNRAMVVCLLLMVPLIPLADPFIFAYLAIFSAFLILSMRSLKSSLLHKIMSLNFLSSGSISFTGRKIPLFIFLSLALGAFLLYAKYALNSLDILFPTLAWRTDTLMTTGLFRIPGTESDFFKFIHLFNLHYGKYYIPLIFILINSVIVWQNRKRFCHHFVRRYPRFLVMYILTFFLELAFLFNPFIPYPPDRFANLSFIILAQIPLMGYSIYVIFLRKGYTLGLGSAVMILCLLWTLGFFTCLSSPYTGGISEGISQNEAEGIHWLSEVKENYPYIISLGEGKEISAVPGSFSGNYNLSTNFSENSATPVYDHTSGPEVVLPLEGSTKNESFYLVVTTFSKALSLNERKYNEESASYVNTRNDYNRYKIYDSLNIEIYEYRP
jgi:hypothetical protein